MNPNALPAGAILNSGKQTYRIVRVLGSGGFGITYLAVSRQKVGNITVPIQFAVKEHFMSDFCERDSDTLQIKTGPGRQTVENSMKDFLGEARRLQQVGDGHPSIVKVNEVFEANNTAYYVMEYLDGESLRSYVRSRGKLTEAETLDLLRPVMEAVDYLHEQRMTHLDIKPDNIMLAREEDASGNAVMRPVLIDFGLSKHYDASGHATSTVNTLGCSDGYAPLEQYAGITTFSPSADIYALAATVLFCLTGKDPRRSTEMLHIDLPSWLSTITPPLTPALKSLLVASLSPLPTSRPASMLIDMNKGGQYDAMAGEDRSQTAAVTDKTETYVAEVLSSSGVRPLNNNESATELLDNHRDNRGVRKEIKPRTVGIIAAIVLGVVLITICLPLFAPTSGHTDARHLDLATERDGKYTYFTEAEWNSVPTSEQSRYIKKGIVISQPSITTPFILALTDNEKDVTWDEAMASGINMPTKIQGEVIVKDCVNVEKSLKDFSGTGYYSEYSGCFWTREAKDSSYAWIVSLYGGLMIDFDKANTYRVRAVAPLPYASGIVGIAAASNLSDIAGIMETVTQDHTTPTDTTKHHEATANITEKKVDPHPTNANAGIIPNGSKIDNDANDDMIDKMDNHDNRTSSTSPHPRRKIITILIGAKDLRIILREYKMTTTQLMILNPEIDFSKPLTPDTKIKVYDRE